MTETELVTAYQDIFAGRNGGIVLEDLDRAGMFNIPDRCFDRDSERTTCFNLGKLSMIRYIHGKINKSLIEPETKKVKHEEIING